MARISRANSRAHEMLGAGVIGLTIIEVTRSYEIDAVVQSTLGQHRGRIDRFSLDALVNMLARAGKQVSVKVRKAA